MILTVSNHADLLIHREFQQGNIYGLVISKASLSWMLIGSYGVYCEPY